MPTTLKKVTISDVARKAGVSIATVSRVLNNSPLTKTDTKNRIKKLIKDLGYRPNKIAQSLARKEKFNGVIFLPTYERVYTSSVASEIIRGMVKGIHETGKNITFVVSGKVNPIAYFEHFDYNNYEFVIFIDAHVNKQNYHILKSIQVPTIFIDYYSRHYPVNCISVDNKAGIRQAVNYLISLGHKKIGFIKGSDNNQPSRERFSGFKSAMKSKSLRVNNSFICDGGFDYNIAYKNCLKLLKKKNRPTAIISSSDLMAFGIYNVARKLSISIPEDLSVIGFDDVIWSPLAYPPLTTVKQPLFDMGYWGIKKIIEINKFDNIIKLRLKPSLKIRESCRNIL